jgi:hypothetical protein
VNDEEMLVAMRRSLAGAVAQVHMTRPPEAITARARARRLRRVLSGAGTAGTALGVGLVLAFSGGQAARPVNVNLDAWSVNTTSDGLIKVTIREMEDPVLLRQTLAEAGIPAVVTFGKFCMGQPVFPNGNIQKVAPFVREGPDVVFTLRPAAMPPGAELILGTMIQDTPFRVVMGQVSLSTKGFPLTCSIKVKAWQSSPAPTASAQHRAPGPP